MLVNAEPTQPKQSENLPWLVQGLEVWHLILLLFLSPVFILGFEVCLARIIDYFTGEDQDEVVNLTEESQENEGCEAEEQFEV